MGNRDEARRLLRRALEQDVNSETAWLWLASVAESAEERIDNLERALRINPANERARKELDRLRAAALAAPVPVPQPTPTPAVIAPQPAPILIAPKPRRASGPRLNPALLSFLGVVAVGVVILIILPLSNTSLQPTALPVIVTPTSRLPFSAQQLTAYALSSTPPPRVTIATLPPAVVFNVASWTPEPSFTPVPSFTPSPAPSPLDTLTLAFAGEGRGRSAIGLYTIRANGANEALLGKGSARAFDVAFAPDARHIAYITDADGHEQLAIADTDGSNERVLTSFKGKFTRTPSWNADGTQIAVTSDDSGTDELYLVPAAGGSAERLFTARTNSRDPAFSPDGKRIAYAGDPTGRGSYQIYGYDPETKKSAQLTEGQGSNYSPAWSPDGSRIAFISTRDGRANVYLMNAQGEDEQPLTIGSGAEQRDPAFSPDGRWVAFSSNREGGIFQIFVTTLDGLLTRQVTNTKTVSVGPCFVPREG